MKLKKLEITGFKSFHEKVSIEFSFGISAVVGPNGCGKSNIIDALRWVMGEQSVKQLRGKSMEDVIFSGTNGKPPLSMAEVSLTLLNDNGNVPEELKDFSEIMLTRRLYRSGESAYLINKRACRLKDIHNVFWGSGMGAKSCAVIQQGSIGAITDAGPEERRFIIEEAAGITRYKNRKNEALHKVKATDQNILRLNDIIAEINRQMATLKRQAKKAELYNDYNDRIKEIDIYLGLYYYDDYTKRTKASGILLNDLKNADIEHTSKLKELDAAVEEIKLEQCQKNQDISEQKSRKFEIHRTIDRLENDLAHFRNDVKRLADETSSLESARRDLEEKNRGMISEVAEVEKENESLNQEIKGVNSALEEEKKASQDTKDRLLILNQAIERSKTELMDLVAQEARHKNICQNASNNKESLKRRLERIDEEEVTAGEKLIDLQNNKSRAQKALESFKREISDLKERIDALSEHLENKSRALGKQVKFVQTLELDRNKDKSKYSTLKKMEDNFEWYKDGVRAIMKAQTQKDAVQNPAMPDNSCKQPVKVIGLMADIIEPEPSFETAIEAVLGESLQYILVKNHDAGCKLIDDLKRQKSGRSGFVPVSSVRQIECKGEKVSDPEKMLINHVSIKPGFERVAKALLGHVVFAVDIEEALRIYNNGSFNTIVTKSGDVISDQGIMIGGSKDRLSGILAKKQEVKNLKRKIAAMDLKLEIVRNDQKEKEAALRTIESEMQKLIEQKNRAGQNEIEAEKVFYKATESLKHARRHLEIVRLEQEQLLGERDDIDKEMVKHNKAAAEVESLVKKAQESVVETTGKIDIATSEMENFNHRIVDLKLKFTALNAKIENSNNTLRRIKEFQKDGIERLEQLSLEIVRKNRKKISLKHKTEEYEQTLSGMYDEVNRLEQAIGNNEADYNDIDARLKENDSVVSDIQSRRGKTLEKIRLLELEQAQNRIKRENIADRLSENYRKSFSELRIEFNETSNNYNESQEISKDEMENKLSLYRKKIASISDVNLGAIKEYEQNKERYDFLCAQRDDLVKAVNDLNKVVRKIDSITQERFIKTFNQVNEKLNEVFPRLFEGGSADLVLTEPDRLLETGVEYMIHPPGKKLTRMSLLSGGEKALSAIALVFSIFLIKPASFCLMDEIDAPLDDVNVFRFNNLLKIIGEKSQIVMVTHNKNSMEFADILFGITMQKKGISEIVSVDLERHGGLN